MTDIKEILEDAIRKTEILTRTLRNWKLGHIDDGDIAEPAANADEAMERLNKAIKGDDVYSEQVTNLVDAAQSALCAANDEEGTPEMSALASMALNIILNGDLL